DCYPHLIELVRDGSLPESLIDDRIRPMLRAKFLLGLFDDPYIDPDVAEQIVRAPEHRELALEAARRTITLLKNDRNVLPLAVAGGRLRSIAVIGPNADRLMLGGYSGVPLHTTTVLQGIRDRAPADVTVLYHEGCKITVGGSWRGDEVTPSEPETDPRNIRGDAAPRSPADVAVP